MHNIRVCVVLSEGHATIYKTKKICYNSLTMRKIRIPYNENNQRYFYSCPFYGELETPKGFFPIPTCMTATALTIYYQFFYRSHCTLNTNTKLLPFHRYILWLKSYEICQTTDFSIFMAFLCQCPFTTLPQKGFHPYTKEKEFYAEARNFILSSHKWDWVVPHLRKIYPQLIFGDLSYDTE